MPFNFKRMADDNYLITSVTGDFEFISQETPQPQLDGLRVIKVQDKTGTQDFHVQVETELCCESSNMG